MDNQKIENLLNLAMEATAEEREKSLDLNVGFDRETASWEVIVKFFGTEEELKEVFRQALPDDYSDIRIQSLSSKYAILEIPENVIDRVAALPEIEYMEKPKRLFFAVNNGKSVSCINPLQTGAVTSGQAAVPGGTGRNNLTGRNTLVAIVDSGERVIIMPD